MTEYEVMEQRELDTGDQPDGSSTTDVWVPIGLVEAHSAEQAIRKAIDGRKNPAGTFVATPERSFQPLTVGVETKKVTRLTPAGASSTTEPEPEPEPETEPTDDERIAPAAPVH